MKEQVAVGDILAGKYRVERVLGAGGMGVVVAARHVQLDVLVALKFMSDEALSDQELVARFLREARAAARLRGEHVARVTDVGTLESGAPFQVIEYLEGNDLQAILSSRGPMPIALAAQYVAQACEAVEEAHRAGIVHRDIKPANLFLTYRPNGTACIKVLDFGLSKAERLHLSGPLGQTSGTEGLFGSPSYMAPEQMLAPREVDGRADIWGLGATLYELVSGRVPFLGDTVVEVAFRVAQSEPTPLRELRPDVPPALELITRTCLEKDRERRFATAGMLALALAPFAEGAPERTPIALGRTSPNVAALLRPLPGVKTSWASRVPAVAAGCGLVGALAAVLWTQRLSPGPVGAVEPGAHAVAAAVAPPLATAAVVPVAPFGGSASSDIPTLSVDDLPVVAQPAQMPLVARAPALAPIAPASAPASPAPALAPASAPASPALAPASAPASAPSALAPSGEPAAPPTPVATPVAATARGDAGCSPPFVVDDVGHMHFKPECLP